MENREFLTRCANLAKEYVALYEETGLCAVNSYFGPSIHLTEGCFKKHFETFLKERRDDPEYPVELSATVDGVRFFCICKGTDRTGGGHLNHEES